MITKPENDYASGLDQYPRTVTEAYNHLNLWKRNEVVNTTTYNDGIPFAQGSSSGMSEKRLGRDWSCGRCHFCGKLGHHTGEGKCDSFGSIPDDLHTSAESANAMGQNDDAEVETGADNEGNMGQ